MFGYDVTIFPSRLRRTMPLGVLLTHPEHVPEHVGRVGVCNMWCRAWCHISGGALWGGGRSRWEDSGLQFLSRAEHRGVWAAWFRGFVYADQHGQLSDGLQVQRGITHIITFNLMWCQMYIKVLVFCLDNQRWLMTQGNGCNPFFSIFLFFFLSCSSNTALPQLK